MTRAGNDQTADYRAASGQREITNDWIAQYYPRIHRAVWMMTGDRWEAEDLAQETFVVALDRWNQFEGRSSDATWLYGILVRLAQRRTRSLSRMRRRLMQYVERNGLVQVNDLRNQDPQAELARKQWRESVWADVARLPPAQRIAVTLRFAEEMSYEQIEEETQHLHHVGWIDSEEIVPVDLSQFSSEQRKGIEAVLDQNVTDEHFNL